MKFQLLTTTLYALVAITSALPAEDLNLLDARAVNVHNLPSKSIQCPDGKNSKGQPKFATYSKKEIQNAITKAVELNIKGETIGPDRSRKFPYPISNPASLPGIPAAYHDAKDVQHFPMSNGKSAWNGKRAPKNERVMYAHDGKSEEATFIGLWTHEGSETGQYQHCTEK